MPKGGLANCDQHVINKRNRSGILSGYEKTEEKGGGGLKYRHELKYLIDRKQLEILRIRLLEMMRRDPCAGERGFYQVRSLYFDDYENRCYYENENGTDPREKFRMRIYNGCSHKICLELKQKRSMKTKKRSCALTEEQCRRIMSGEGLHWEEAEGIPLLEEFFLRQREDGLRGKVIVEYERVPFVCPDGNVRITLDTDIRSSSRTEDFLNERISARPIMPLGKNLLEVKYDEFLPDFIYRGIQMRGLQQTAFSKYYICRKFTI